MKPLLAALLFIVATTATAAAQKPGGQPEQTWRPIAIEGGCTIVSASLRGMEARFSWDQPCAPGQPIEGRGTLHITVSDTESATLTGTFVAGVPHGVVVMTVYENGAAISEQTAEYNMGCAIGAEGCSPYRPG